MATFSTVAPNNAWMLIVDGAAYAGFGVQLDASSPPVLIVVATEAPAIDDDNYIRLASGSDRSFSELLSSTEKVYARAATSRGGKLRGSRTAR